MKKIVIERPGGYHRLKVKEFPTPTPQKNEVLIEVSAAGMTCGSRPGTSVRTDSMLCSTPMARRP